MGRGRHEGVHVEEVENWVERPESDLRKVSRVYLICIPAVVAIIGIVGLLSFLASVFGAWLGIGIAAIIVGSWTWWMVKP